MNDLYLAEIKASGKTCYFVSPHFDDAVYSSGALITELAKTNDVAVINIFTRAGKRPYTLSAKQYLKQCKYNDAEVLYEDRAKEDKQALLDITTNVIDLGFTEALWRKTSSKFRLLLDRALPEFGNIYPTYRLHITKGRISGADKQTILLIKQQLMSILAQSPGYVFCPLAVGSHIDHVITRYVCDEIFPDAIHWVDYPYSLTNDSSKLAEGMKTFVFGGNSAEKLSLIKKYTTQYDAIFKDNIILRPELYHFKHYWNDAHLSK